MKLIPMETFCCCCKLETGGLIMGILATITSVGFFISSLFSYSESMDNIRDHFLLTDLLKDGPDHVVHIVFITMTAIDVGSSVLLLVGVLKVSIDDCRIHLCGTMCNYFRFWKSCLSNESRRRNFTYILHEMPQQYIFMNCDHRLFSVFLSCSMFMFHNSEITVRWKRNKITLNELCNTIEIDFVLIICTTMNNNNPNQ